MLLPIKREGVRFTVRPNSPSKMDPSKKIYQISENILCTIIIFFCIMINTMCKFPNIFARMRNDIGGMPRKVSFMRIIFWVLHKITNFKYEKGGRRMKHYVKRCLTALLAVALAFTMFPSSMARASEGKALQEAAQAAGEGSEQEAPQAVDAMGLLASFDFNTEPLDGKMAAAS